MKSLLHCSIIYAIIPKSETVLILILWMWPIFFSSKAYRIFSLFWNFTMIYLVCIYFHALCWALEASFQCGNPILWVLGSFLFSLFSLRNSYYLDVGPLDFSDFLICSLLFSIYQYFLIIKLTFIDRFSYNGSSLKK